MGSDITADPQLGGFALVVEAGLKFSFHVPIGQPGGFPITMSAF